MINDKQINSTIKYYERKLLNKVNAIKIKANRDWAKQFSKEAGVYLIFENNKICYVGESGSLRKRMHDFLDTRNHIIRRNLANFNFSKDDNFEKGEKDRKFIPEIEDKINKWYESKLKVSAIVVPFGRKELEEYLIEKNGIPKYNKKGKRKV